MTFLNFVKKYQNSSNYFPSLLNLELLLMTLLVFSQYFTRKRAVPLAFNGSG